MVRLLSHVEPRVVSVPDQSSISCEMTKVVFCRRKTGLVGVRKTRHDDDQWKPDDKVNRSFLDGGKGMLYHRSVLFLLALLRSTDGSLVMKELVVHAVINSSAFCACKCIVHVEARDIHAQLQQFLAFCVVQ